MPDLRERRRNATQADLVTTALELFTERGFDATTMDDVADAAGVSRRTLYRYFPRKDDLVFAAPVGWLVEWDAVIADRRPQEPLYELMRRGARAVAQQIAADPQPVLTSARISHTTPSLLLRRDASTREWRDRIAALVGSEIGADPATDARCTVTAGAIMGAIDGMLKAWAASAGKRDPVAMTDEVIRRLEPAWPTLIEAEATARSAAEATPPQGRRLQCSDARRGRRGPPRFSRRDAPSSRARPRLRARASDHRARSCFERDELAAQGCGPGVLTLASAPVRRGS